MALPLLLISHQPLDLVIILLGTNDIKFAARCRAFDASMGMERLVQIIKSANYMKGYKVPEILIMWPTVWCPRRMNGSTTSGVMPLRDSKLFAKHYERVAEELNVHFFDAGSVAVADKTDGGHLDAANTKAIGVALVPVVKKILSI